MEFFFDTESKAIDYSFSCLQPFENYDLYTKNLGGFINR